MQPNAHTYTIITDEVNREYAKWLKWFTKQEQFTGLSPILVSGFPPVRSADYVSDVDVNVLVTPSQLDELWWNIPGAQTSDHRDKGYLTAHYVGELEINVRFTTELHKIKRAWTHRINEIALATARPDLAAQVAKLKTAPKNERLKTEPAWALVLGAEADVDPWDFMTRPIDELMTYLQ